MTSLRRLEYFLAVARERNFTRAAERLHVAQPALSRQVRELERELGTELIHRTTHDFELTDAGALLLARGPELLASADALWRSVRAHGSGESGDVVVAYGASASYDTAPRLLEALARDQPGIAIETEVRAARRSSPGCRTARWTSGSCAARRSAGPGAPDLRADRQGLLMRHDHRLAAATGPTHRPVGGTAPTAPEGGEPRALRRRARSVPRAGRRAARRPPEPRVRPQPGGGRARRRGRHRRRVVLQPVCPPSSRGVRSHRPGAWASTSSHGATIARPRWSGCSMPRTGSRASLAGSDVMPKRSLRRGAAGLRSTHGRQQDGGPALRRRGAGG